MQREKPSPLQLVLCFDGTFGSLADKNNSIVNLFQHCTLPGANKFYFQGPGTDATDALPNNAYWISNVARKAKNTVTGMMAGLDGSQIGTHSVAANLSKALVHIKQNIIDAQRENKPLQLYLFGWSRGGYTALLLLKEIKELIKTMKVAGEINTDQNEDDLLAGIYMDNIDPVPGGPTDRLYLSHYSQFKHPTVPIIYKARLSDTGNMPKYESIRPEFLANRNMPFFSLLFDSNLNTSTSHQFIFPLTHGDIASIGNTNPDLNDMKSSLSRVVFADMVLTAKLHGLSFDPEWEKTIIEEGFTCLKQCEGYFERNPIQTNRGFLTYKNPYLPTGIDKLPLSNLRDMALYQSYQKKIKWDAWNVELKNISNSETNLTSNIDRLNKLNVSIQKDLDNLTKKENELKTSLTDLESKIVKLKNEQNELNSKSFIHYNDDLAVLLNLTEAQKKQWGQVVRKALGFVDTTTSSWVTKASNAVSYVESCWTKPTLDSVKSFLLQAMTDTLRNHLSEKQHVTHTLSLVTQDLKEVTNFKKRTVTNIFKMKMNEITTKLNTIDKDCSSLSQTSRTRFSTLSSSIASTNIANSTVMEEFIEKSDTMLTQLSSLTDEITRFKKNQKIIDTLYKKILTQSFDSPFLWANGKTISGKNEKVPNHVYQLFKILEKYNKNENKTVDLQNALFFEIQHHITNYLGSVQKDFFTFHRKLSIQFHQAILDEINTHLKQAKITHNSEPTNQPNR